MSDDENAIGEDELQGLLDQLDEKEDFVVDAMEAGCPAGEPGEEKESGNGEEKEPGNNGEEILNTSNAEAAIKPAADLIAIDARRFEDGKQILTGDEDEDKDEVGGVQISRYLEKLDDVTDEVLAACRSDRQEAQDVIGIYKKAVEDAVNNGNPPARMWVDGLVKAVEVKSGINTNAVKIIEANAKMLAATKAGSINTQVNIGGADNLEDVLSEELNEQDEY